MSVEIELTDIHSIIDNSRINNIAWSVKAKKEKKKKKNY